MMTMAEFQNLLDAFGAYPAAWPADKRDAATRLIAAEPQARSVLEHSSRLDAAIAQSLNAKQADGRRVLMALATRPLPRQRRGFLAWPAALLTDDFAPAWPRVAALASVAVLGFAIGLVGFDLEGSISAVAAVSRADAGLSVVAFEPEPLTGVRP
jgi:anti-sigma-K factor RskA